MNMELFRLINNLANKNIMLDKIMILFSKYMPYLFMLIIALMFISAVITKNGEGRKAAVNTFVITVINLVLSFIVGSIYYVDRPFVHNKVNLLYSHVEDASFPSDHAIGTMSIALGLKKYNKVLGRILTVFSIIVGFSRIYVGHHYPTDVIGAYLIAVLTSYIYNAKLSSIVGEIYDKVERKVAGKLGFNGLYQET